MQPGLDRLQAESIARDLFARYVTSIDHRDFAMNRDVFHDDVEVTGFPDAPTAGLDAWIEWVGEELKKYRRTQHLMGAQLLTSVSPVRFEVMTQAHLSHILEEHRDVNWVVLAEYRWDVEERAGRWAVSRHEITSLGAHFVRVASGAEYRGKP